MESSSLPFSNRPLRIRIIISYIFDYVILIALMVGFYILDRVEPFHQPFAINNISLFYPYAEHDRVSVPLALALSGGFPLLVIFIYTIVIDGLFSHNKPVTSSGKRKFTGPYSLKDRLWEFNCGFLGLFLAQASAFVITGALKNAVGKPRPDIIDRCRPKGVDSLGPHELVTFDMCDSKLSHDILKDGFRSFPSASFAGLFYLSLYLAGKFHLLDSRGEVWKTFLSLFPTLGAGLIAATRIMDARHHPFDVLFGSLLGILCGYVAYRQYFPPLSEPWRKGRAYPIRTWGTGPTAPSRSRFDMGGSNDSVAPLRRADDLEYQATSTGQDDEFTRKPPPVRRMSSDRISSADPYLRRRQELEREYSSSGDSAGVAFEMQPGSGSRSHRSESTTHLNTPYKPPQTSYQPYPGRTASPAAPSTPPLPTSSGHPGSHVEPPKI
ncbi:PAP2 domain-containing protein [Histoplasma capsulatum var. duboisii H88]|uniref:PAP2 domain-containing protein n=1 Tax=Ajellomyces capsulatus (strain H88) TaxID=544711 RepID=F0U6B7_AJEC8|nr:PAP2 domain-containing protein [Histoplasma capsulatum var. duboisii H88]